MSDEINVPVTETAMPPRKNFVNYFAIVFTVIVLGFDSCLFFVPIPPANRDIIMTLVGMLNGTGVITIINYFFGSSKSSKDKDETIKTLSQ